MKEGQHPRLASCLTMHAAYMSICTLFYDHDSAQRECSGISSFCCCNGWVLLSLFSSRYSEDTVALVNTSL